MRNRRRLNKLEHSNVGDTIRRLDARGFSKDRIRELIQPDGTLDVEKCTDEELDRIAGDGIQIGATFVEWSDVSDRELQRIIDGEPPAEVLARHLTG